MKTDWFTRTEPTHSPAHLKRYSRFVGGMKLVLPSLAAALVLTLMAWSSTNAPPPPPRKATSLDSTMSAPVYESRDEKGQPYKVEADIARQDPATPNNTDLANPRAEIQLEGGSTLKGEAEGAKYDQKDGKLEINGNLTLHHSSGAVFETEKATVDMNSHTAAGNAPVKVTGNFGEVNAEGFQLANEGKTVIFTGRSTAHLKMGGGQGSPLSSLQDFLPKTTKD